MVALWIDAGAALAVDQDDGETELELDPPGNVGAFLAAVRATAPDWHADAACREHPEVSWFPDRGQDPRPAKAVCARCLVRDECRAWALDNDPGGRLVGIWGGTSGRDRRRVATLG